MKLKDICSLEGKKKNYDQPRQHIKKQRHCFADKGPSSRSYGFSSSHAWVWELDHKESWAPKNWCFWTVVLEKTLKSPLDCKRLKQSILKERSSQYSVEGLMLKLKLQCFGHLMRRTDSLEKTLILGEIKVRRRRGQQRMRLLEASPTGRTWIWAISGSCDGQGSLSCCSPGGRKELNTTEPNWKYYTHYVSGSLLKVGHTAEHRQQSPHFSTFHSRWGVWREKLDKLLKNYFCCTCVCVCSLISNFLWPHGGACQVPLPMEFSRQEYQSRLPFPSPGNLPDPGIKPLFLASPAVAGGFFTTSATWDKHWSRSLVLLNRL